MNHAISKHTWNALTSSPQPDTSLRRSDVLGKWTEYMVSRWWRLQLFSRRIQKRWNLVGLSGYENRLLVGLDGQPGLAQYYGNVWGNEWMDNMENKGQRMVVSPTKSRFPPTPQRTQRQTGGILGIQDQGMVSPCGKETFVPRRPGSPSNVGWKLPRMYQQEPRSHLRRLTWCHDTMSGKMHIQLTWKAMKNCTGWTQNQDSWGPSDLRRHARRGSWRTWASAEWCALVRRVTS